MVAAFGLVISLAAHGPAASQSVASFYTGKQVKVIVGTGPGGGYDIYGRLLAPYLGRHIPGHPNVIVVNMPGAASMTAANYLANVAPKDGTELLMIVQALPLVQVTGSKSVHFDLGRFNWIGNMSDSANVLIAWHTAPVKTIADAKKDELLVGSTTPSSIGGLYPVVMNQVLGTKLRVINGYESGDAIDLAMQRGEVNGRAGMSWAGLKSARAYWLQNKDINVLVQAGLQKEPDLPDVPLMTDLASDDTGRQVLNFYSSLVALGRAVAVGPGVPTDRVEALRRAFDETLADPDLIAEAEKSKLEVRALSGERLQAVVQTMVSTEPAILHLDQNMISDK
jgi:tripartite-type tricarboxylate transporter receptor subunit TctC